MKARSGGQLPGWEPDVDEIFRFWASRLGSDDVDDAQQEMRIRWLRHGRRARSRPALAHTIAKSVVADRLRKIKMRRHHEDAVDPVALSNITTVDRTSRPFDEQADARLDANRAARLMPALLEQLRPRTTKRRKLDVYELRVEIFNKVYGQKRSPAEVAVELGCSEHWVKECYRDLLRQLAPLLLAASPPDDADAG